MASTVLFPVALGSPLPSRPGIGLTLLIGGEGFASSPAFDEAVADLWDRLVVIPGLESLAEPSGACCVYTYYTGDGKNPFGVTSIADGLLEADPGLVLSVLGGLQLAEPDPWLPWRGSPTFDPTSLTVDGVKDAYQRSADATLMSVPRTGQIDPKALARGYGPTGRLALSPAAQSAGPIGHQELVYDLAAFTREQPIALGASTGNAVQTPDPELWTYAVQIGPQGPVFSDVKFTALMPDGRIEPLGTGHVMLESVFRSVLPVALDRGITTEDAAAAALAELGLDAAAFADRPMLWPLMIGAWKRKGQA